MAHFLSQSLSLDNSARWLLGALLITATVATLIIIVKRNASVDLGALMGIAALFSLIANPYVRNYDALLMIPGFISVESAHPNGRARIALVIIYLCTFVTILNSPLNLQSEIFWALPVLLLGLNVFKFSNH